MNFPRHSLSLDKVALGLEGWTGLVEAQRALLSVRLAQLEAQHARTDPAAFRRLVLDLRRRQTRAVLEWLEYLPTDRRRRIIDLVRGLAYAQEECNWTSRERGRFSVPLTMSLVVDGQDVFTVPHILRRKQ